MREDETYFNMDSICFLFGIAINPSGFSLSNSPLVSGCKIVTCFPKNKCGSFGNARDEEKHEGKNEPINQMENGVESGKTLVPQQQVKGERDKWFWSVGSHSSQGRPPVRQAVRLDRKILRSCDMNRNQGVPLFGPLGVGSG